MKNIFLYILKSIMKADVCLYLRPRIFGLYIFSMILWKIHVYSCHMGKTFLSIYKGGRGVGGRLRRRQADGIGVPWA